MDYEKLIAEEEAIRAILAEKISRCEQRIKLLRSLAETQADDIDEAITKSIAREKEPTPQTVPEKVMNRVNARLEKHDSKQTFKNTVLKFIGNDGKTFHEVVELFKLNGKKLGAEDAKDSFGFVRTYIWKLKKEGSIVQENDRYILSENDETTSATNTDGFDY